MGRAHRRGETKADQMIVDETRVVQLTIDPKVSLTGNWITCRRKPAGVNG